MFDGSVYEFTREKSGTGARHPSWRWSIDGGVACRRCLNHIVPYLVRKRTEGELLLALCNLMGPPGPKLAPEVLIQMQEIAQDLNAVRRGDNYSRASR